ncbi:MAG: hypothetical protein V1903_10375 [Bacteroidota bacterium]
MKKTLIWILAIIITLAAAYYQRKTGPTYPESVNITLNNSEYKLELVRSLGLDERPEVKLRVNDTTVKGVLYYKRFRTEEEYQKTDFIYKVYPIHSFVMNEVFRMSEEKGFFAQIPPQPPAGKLQYYIEITDSKGTQVILKDAPVVIRFKGSVPSAVLTPHIIIMFLAMLFSTATALLALFRIDIFRKYSIWTLILLTAGGMILGPVVQKYAFGELWTGIPFGWDLTDNKTLIAFLFWLLAVIMNRKKERPFYTILAAIVLLLVYSIPHSLFGSELDYSSGQVIQGAILTFFLSIKKNS